MVDRTATAVSESTVFTDRLCECCGISCVNRHVSTPGEPAATRSAHEGRIAGATLTARGGCGGYAPPDGDHWELHLCEACTLAVLRFVKATPRATDLFLQGTSAAPERLEKLLRGKDFESTSDHWDVAVEARALAANPDASRERLVAGLRMLADRHEHEWRWLWTNWCKRPRLESRGFVKGN